LNQGGTGSSAATDINNLGVVVGTTPNGSFIWDAVNGMRRLSTLLAEPLPANWYLGDALAVNDAGQVLVKGSYYVDDNTRPQEHGFLLTPVPEPGSAAALVLCGALPLLRRRSRRAASAATA
jgi:hypothetical protein